MENQRSLPPISRADDVESSMIPGQIEQVVSSADCRSAEQSQDQDEANHQRNRDDGAAGTTPPEGESAEPLLTLEDRLVVALAARGDRSMWQILFAALRSTETIPWGADPDCELVLAVERVVFA